MSANVSVSDPFHEHKLLDDVLNRQGVEPVDRCLTTGFLIGRRSLAR
ncbi:hypothetical protein ABIB81_007526 [Bradyrhizobium sp. I1.7.5]